MHSYYSKDSHATVVTKMLAKVTIFVHFGYLSEISEVPNIQFIGNASNITENNGILTICAVAGQLVQAFTPVNVVISTTTGVARGKSMPY